MEKLTKYNQAFLAYWIPVIEALKELGGSGRPSEVTDLVIERMQIPDEIVAETIKSGPSRVKNQIAWARMYLVENGFLDSSVRGVWSLTEKALKYSLTAEEVQHLFYERKKNRSKNKTNKSDKDNSSKNDEQEIIESIDYQTEMLNTLQGLPPDGFERLCQRLLRESGFEQVKVTGKSGDGGIDGTGILQVNPFVSFDVLFQCKRYKGSVSSPQIRNFRGAMLGRADKGIIITTGNFTADAKTEARRVPPPIELVDGEKLVQMFENLELGLKPKKDFDLDYQFFNDFK